MRPPHRTPSRDEPPLPGLASAARLARDLVARSAAPWPPTRPAICAAIVADAHRVLDDLSTAAVSVPGAAQRRGLRDRRFAEALFEARLCLEHVLATLPDPGPIANRLLALDSLLATVGAAALTELVEEPARAALCDLAPPITGRVWSVFARDAGEPAP